VPVINARFYRRNHRQSGTILFPFNIRVRKYGFEFVDISSEVAEPIKSELRLPVNEGLVATEVQVAATTGISVDFVSETITITENHDSQSLYDYYQYLLAQVANMGYAEDLVKTGVSFDLDDWDMVVDGAEYDGELVTTGTITVQNGGSITGVYQDQNGVILPPQPYSVTNIVPGSRLRIYNVTKDLEFTNSIVNGTSFAGTYSESGGTTFSNGDVIEVTLVKEDKLEYTAVVVDGGNGWSVLADQLDDEVYNAIGIDGSTINIFTADYSIPEVNLTVAQDFTMAEFYAWFKYNMVNSADAMRYIFGSLTAIDQANFRVNTSVADLYLNNDTSVSVKQVDTRRIFRDSGDGYPVKTPTTSGYGLDVVWRSTVLIAETNTSGLTAEEAAALNKAATNSGLIPGLY